jgi:hypothetical protein
MYVKVQSWGLPACPDYVTNIVKVIVYGMNCQAVLSVVPNASVSIAVLAFSLLITCIFSEIVSYCISSSLWQVLGLKACYNLGF